MPIIRTDSLPEELGVELLSKGLNAKDIAAVEILSGRIEELMDKLRGIL